jgi:hypothetical protein
MRRSCGVQRRRAQASRDVDAHACALSSQHGFTRGVDGIRSGFLREECSWAHKSAAVRGGREAEGERERRRAAA